ncbi:MAG TPA: hypothetical protein VNM66_08785, partial [Thermodesulfobacteriota bacterium]|nr:hypothetical protein [Thermodesulfobacteriota bacterium]
MYLTIQLARYDPATGRRIRQPPYVTLEGPACDRLGHLAAAAGLFVPGPHQGRFYQDLRAIGEPRDPLSDGPADAPPERPLGMGWREYNRVIDEWRTSQGLHTGERAYVLVPAQVAQLAAALAAADLGERLVEAARLAGVAPLPSARELLAAVGSVRDRVRPMLEQAAAAGQGIWV